MQTLQQYPAGHPPRAVASARVEIVQLTETTYEGRHGALNIGPTKGELDRLECVARGRRALRLGPSTYALLG